MPLDYSKWKDIEVSDDEDDTHPNIDTPSLFRWRHQARLDRMAERKHEKEELEAGKEDTRRKTAEIEQKLGRTELDAGEKNRLELEMTELREQEKQFEEKEQRLRDMERQEKWNVDTIGQVAMDKSRINKYDDEKKTSLEKTNQADEEDESRRMREFFDRYEDDLKAYSKVSGIGNSEKFITEHPHLAHDYTTSWLTLEALNLAMEFKDVEMCVVAEQCTLIQYLLELAKAWHQNVASDEKVIRAFFKKLKEANPQYAAMMRKDVDDFQDRLRKRGKTKRDAAIAEMEAEEREKRIEQSPGGLDPQQVYETLPQEMRAAFDSQIVSELQKVAETMDKELFAHHLDRCVRSGLWVPAPTDDEKSCTDSEQESAEPKKDR